MRLPIYRYHLFTNSSTMLTASVSWRASILTLLTVVADVTLWRFLSPLQPIQQQALQSFIIMIISLPQRVSLDVSWSQHQLTSSRVSRGCYAKCRPAKSVAFLTLNERLNINLTAKAAILPDETGRNPLPSSSELPLLGKRVLLTGEQPLLFFKGR